MAGGGFGGRCECAGFGLVGWGSLLPFCGEQDMGCRHIYVYNGAHKMKTQPLRCWTHRSYGYTSWAMQDCAIPLRCHACGRLLAAG